MFFASSGPSGVIVLVGAVFLASCVEMVEALTLVVAAGVSRGWRSALEGAAAAALVPIRLRPRRWPARPPRKPLRT